MFRLTLAVCLVGIVIAQVPSFGSCPDAETITTFNVQRYGGRWYEQYRYFAVFEIGAKCVTADYSLNDDGTVKVVNTQLNSFFGRPTSIEGTAKIVDPRDPGKLSVHFPSSPVDGSYWILDTDYESYAAVWSCQNLAIVNAQFAWILTRKQNVSEAVMGKAKDAFKRNNITLERFEQTNQIDCQSKRKAAK